MTIILAVAGAILAVFYGVRFTNATPSMAKSIVKTGSTACLALAATGLSAPWLIAVGLTMGAFGDYFLSRAGERAFLAGMAAFALGHLCYAVLFVSAAQAVAHFAAIAVIGLAVSTEFWLAPHTGNLRWPVRAYVAVIAMMGVAAAALPAAGWLVQVGAGLFILSDLLLALQLFVVVRAAGRRRLGLMLWPAYWGGQALIVIGSLDLPVG